MNDEVVVHARLIPPRLPRHWLRRPRLDQLLSASAEYPATVVSASAGYGKSSALASFAARGGWPTAWYSLSEGVAAARIFLIHLVHAFRRVVPQVGERTLERLQQRGQPEHARAQALDALIDDLTRALDDETILILDDVQTIDDLPEVNAIVERLLLFGPPLLHIVLATRHWPQLACLTTLQARGELFVIGEAELAFTNEEIAELFELLHDHVLDDAAIRNLADQTGGWPIALHLASQTAFAPIDKPLSVPHEPDSSTAGWPREVLFEYLAREALQGQPADVQDVLLRSSVLTELDPAACEEALDIPNAHERLRALGRRGLFLISDDEHLHYHPLFHAFLQQRAREVLPEWTDLHRRAAAFFRARGAYDKVLHHLLAVGDNDEVAQELTALAMTWLNNGRAAALLAWLDQLPRTTQDAHPALLLARGDAARQLAHFNEALGIYRAAEKHFATHGDVLGEAQALRGQALVYLDTVRPAPAQTLLRRAFKLLPRDQPTLRADLLRLIAENRLNSGRAAQAARLYRVADRLDHAGAAREANPRVFLRLGQLDQARSLLEQRLHEADDDQRQPEAHRETTLLLALIYTLLGNPERALYFAQSGLAAAERRAATHAQAVAHIRLGHALQLGPTADYDAANTHYLQAITHADALNVQRIKAEAFMGLALLHGFAGDVTAAQAAAHEGRHIVEQSGDAWLAALLWTALGAVGVANGAPGAPEWLAEALTLFQNSKDTYGQTLVHMWKAILHQRGGQTDDMLAASQATLALVERHGYHGLLSSITLFGPRDRMMLVPILLTGRATDSHSAIARELLAHGFPAIAADEGTQTYHPGLTLRVQLFERLRVWRGTEEIEPRAWQRKKAQQLLALLLTNRYRWMLRDQICDALWPADSRTDAETQFKVTLNALNNALEPLRPPRTSPFYIRRQGSAYRFQPPDGVWIDVIEFENQFDHAKDLMRSADGAHVVAAQDALTTAVRLYGGDYLSEYLYEDWSREERERLAVRFLEAATMLAELLLQQNQHLDAIRLCEAILSRDPCWEEAYRLLMHAYARQGNRRLALATFERCERNLREHLNIAPLPQTVELYESIKA